VNRIWADFKLPIVIASFALVAAVIELARGPVEPIAPDAAIESAYPGSERVQVVQGVALAREGRLEEAAALLGASFDRGFKENEDLYAAYVDVLVRTQAPRARIALVRDRWRRDYPASRRLADMEERLRRSNILP